MVRAPVLRRMVPLVVCGLSSACALVMSFDDFDPTHSNVGEPRSVRGSIDGLEKGAQVRLRVNGGSELVRPNGPFTIERAFTPGRAYRIDADSEGYVCTATPQSAPVAPDTDLEANVHCASTNARLASLTFVDGSLEPAFDPATTRYGLTAPLLRFVSGIPGTATPESESAIVSSDPGAVPGAPGAAVPLVFVGGTQKARVQASSGASGEYGVDRVVHATLVKDTRVNVGAMLGWAVAVSGDTLAVGAPNEGTFVGATHLFRRVDGAWREEVVLTPSTFKAAARFGTAIALRGDVLAVGAPDAGVNGTTGVVFVYRRRATGWAEEAVLNGGDQFGTSVALFDDMLVVGAMQDSSSTGAADIYRHAGSTWSFEARVTSSAGSRFGAAVAATADRIVVGAPNENGYAGAAYVFAHTGTTWTLEKRLAPYDGSAQDAKVGESVAIDGDTIAVGASGDQSVAAGIGADAAPDPSKFNVGAAYVYRARNGDWIQEAFIKAQNPQENAAFGSVVSLARDLLVVGAPGEASSATGIDSVPNAAADRAGAAYVFVRTATSWSRAAYVKAALTHRLDAFGSSVSTDGVSLAVGAPQEGSNLTGIVVDPDPSDAGVSQGRGGAYAY